MVRLVFLSTVLVLGGCRKNDVRASLEKGRDAVYAHKPNEALRWYHTALEGLERDESPEAQVIRARALRGAGDVYYLELKDYRRAVEAYRELVQLCPEAPETLGARLHLADVLEREFHDLRGAIAALNDALARNPPQSAELAYRVAKIYFELGDYRQCELEAQRVITKYETSPFVDDAMMLRAQAVAMVEGRRGDAVRLYQELVDKFPDSELQPHALFEIGKLTSDSGDTEKAIEVWVACLKRHPEPQAVQTVIAVARRQLRTATPVGIGDATKAFDRDVPGSFVPHKMAKSSIEAVGGTPDEAAAEAKMRGEEVPAGEAPKPAPKPEAAPAPAPAAP
ncbi:MAG: tetratricopeptide repeat protein [Myxococcaceae bacterium]|nr:tetratricopeptide repeat protein [Myxococcaceae bacterium]